MMANGIEYLLLFTCDLYFLSGEMSLHVFAHFLIGLFVGFLPLSFESSLYILDTSLLLDMWLVNNFS